MVRMLVQCLDRKEERVPLDNITIENINSCEKIAFNGTEYLFYLLVHLLLIEVEMVCLRFFNRTTITQLNCC